MEDISAKTTPGTPPQTPDTAKTAKIEARPRCSDKSRTLDEQKLRQPESALIRWLYRAPTHDLNAPPAGDSETGFKALPGR